jgi:transposase
MQRMDTNAKPNKRVIGFDSHPDSFTAAIVRGPTPAAAITEKTFHKVPLSQLMKWALTKTTPEDLFLLEASGNSFQVVRWLETLGRKALVLESQHLGKLKEAHANNDRISAIRIAKAYLAGTAKEVWVPDQKTQERRDWFQVYQKAVKRTTQMTNRISSYLSDHGVRLSNDLDLSSQEAEPQLQKAKPWTPRQWQVLQGYLMDLRHAYQQRTHWENLISQEVMEDPVLLSLVRLCGVRHITAFALGAVIGDINRFADPKKLVKYFGLYPAFDDSGNEQWSGGVKGHGRRDVRSLLIQGAQAVLRTKTSLGQWGRRLAYRKGHSNVAVVAVARKMVVAIWYLLKGQWTALEEVDNSLKLKVGKILSHVNEAGFKALQKTRQQLREEVLQRLKTGRVYSLDPNKKMPPKKTSAPGGLASPVPA